MFDIFGGFACFLSDKAYFIIDDIRVFQTDHIGNIQPVTEEDKQPKVTIFKKGFTVMCKMIDLSDLICA